MTPLFQTPVECAALLFVKRHSTRVPGKNFRQLGDKPLFRWILDTLLSVPQIERIVVDSDDPPQLLSSGLIPSNRVVVRERPPEVRGDEVVANELLASVLPVAPANLYLMTHATNPFLSARTIEQAIAAYRAAAQSGIADSLVAVNEHRSRFFFANGRPLNHDPARLVPTQALEPIYEDNSNLYLFTAESFASTGSRVGRRPLLFPTPKNESIDIDTPDDWLLAERLAASRQA